MDTPINLRLKYNRVYCVTDCVREFRSQSLLIVAEQSFVQSFTQVFLFYQSVREALSCALL